MNNLRVYEAVRVVPPEAKKTIGGGRLKGMTDINPMWRIKVLTEQFGPAGQGWYYEITEQKIEEGANGEKVAFVNINLYVKYENEWSKPIQGTGGSSFIAKESKGLFTSDECFKMALTDAISVACKALGVGANVYWDKDRTKYGGNDDNSKNDDPRDDAKMKADVMHKKIDQIKVNALLKTMEEVGSSREGVEEYAGCKIEDMTIEIWGTVLATLNKRKGKSA